MMFNITTRFRIIVLFLLVALSYDSIAQKVKFDIDALSKKQTVASMPMLVELLSIPNDTHFEENVEPNVAWAEKALAMRGFTHQRLATEAAPMLLAERKHAKATKTALLYMHLDGQPVDPSKWQQPSPWVPVLKERGADGNWQIIPFDKITESFDPDWRVFGRSSSDDKGPFAMLLAAIDAIDQQKFTPNFNIKVILDFEEELGSPYLPAAVEKYKDLLTADMILIFDGPRHLSNKPTLVFGARGIATITLTTFGPKAAQHSGHYGNYSPNPAFNMARLLASMKDAEGRVIIPGFYDGIALTDEELKILSMVPDNEADIKRNLGIATVEKVGRTYQESLQYPSLNIRGMQSGWVGNEVRTIVPATAVAEIDVRLVPECDPERLISLIRNHIEAQGCYVLDRKPTEEERLKFPNIVQFDHEISYAAFRSPFDSAPGKWLERAMTRAFGKPPIMMRISGGSVPISPFVNILGVPAVTVPTVNPDNNQHGPNENLRLGNYQEGIKTILAILTEKY